MKKLAGVLISMAAFGLVVDYSIANDEDKPREGQRDGAGPGEGRRDGGRGREGRGPRDGDPPRERGPRDGDRPEGRGPRDGEGRGPGNPLIAALDANRNGVLESEEIDNAVAALRKLDRNKDGKLTANELGGGRPPRDGDRPPGDGPPREGGRGEGGRGEGGRGEGGRGEGGRGEGGRGEGRPSPEQLMARFKEADKNEDGKLSREEAPGRMKEGFDRIDADGSGFVEKSEMEAMIKRIQQGGGRPQRDGAGRGGRGGDRPRDGGGEGKPRRPAEE